MLSFIANCQHKDKFWLLKFCSTGSVMIWMISFKPQHHSINFVGRFLTVYDACSHLFLAMTAPLTGNLMIDAADFDLTGQLVWPGAVIMNNYLSQYPEIVNGYSVIELGSGIGEIIRCRAPFSLWSYVS
jgi:hypothetical protein